METQARKLIASCPSSDGRSRLARKRRKNDDSDNKVELDMSNYFTSDEEEESVPSIPSLVSVLFLGSLTMGDVALLRTCRLVCKTWNDLACESLRACSIVRLQESQTIRLDGFAGTLFRRSVGPMQPLPSPFQNFSAEGTKFTEPMFITMLMQPSIILTRLTLQLDAWELDVSQLCHIFAVQKSNIKDLIISQSPGFVLDGALAGHEIQLTSLKRLEIMDTCVNCLHVPFTTRLLSKCTLQSVTLKIYKGELLIMNLLPENKVDNLKHLVLQIGKISTGTWEHLGKLKFPKLKTLSFTARDLSNGHTHSQQLLSFLQNVSPSLEELETNFQFSHEPALVFPKLKILNVWNSNYLDTLNPIKFPALSEVTYNAQIPLFRTVETGSVPHNRVSSLILNIPGINSTDSLDNDLRFLLTYLKRQFRKVSTLVFSVQKFYSNTLPYIWESFRKLTALTLDGVCDFYCFSGIDESRLTEYLELGLSIKEIPRGKSIMDFMELEILSFSSKFFVKPNMISYCLPRLPKLKQVKLHWNDTLSATLLRDSLSHLEKIVISDSSESTFQEAMIQVSKNVPNALME